MIPAALSIDTLSKSFGSARALDKVSLSVAPGEMVALLGASGSGKSTLLRLTSGLHRADPGSGALRVFGALIQQGGQLSPQVRAARGTIGVVFQQFNLVDRSSVLINVLAGTLHGLPLWRGLLNRFTPAQRLAALAALEQVGIAEHAYKRASALSVGQQQRAAIARAMLQGARLITADEPIASLDPESARRVMALLAQVHRERGVTVLVSLHQLEAARQFCPRTIALRAGRVVFDGPTSELTDAKAEALYGPELEALRLDPVFTEPKRTFDESSTPAVHRNHSPCDGHHAHGLGTGNEVAELRDHLHRVDAEPSRRLATHS